MNFDPCARYAYIGVSEKKKKKLARFNAFVGWLTRKNDTLLHRSTKESLPMINIISRIYTRSRVKDLSDLRVVEMRQEGRGCFVFVA